MGDLCEGLQLVVTVTVEFGVFAQLLVGHIDTSVRQLHQRLLKNSRSDGLAAPSTLQLKLMTIALVVLQKFVESHRDVVHTISRILSLSLNAANDSR